jgi:ribose transport system permease protein
MKFGLSKESLMRNVQLALSLAASVLVTLLAGSRRYIHHRHRCGNHQRIVMSVFRVSALIATLATGSILGGAAFAYSRGAPARAPTGIANFAVQTRLGISNSCWTALVIVVIVAVLCAKRVWGRQLAAVGTNEAAARQSGMRVKALIVSAYISSALCASIAGIVLAGYVKTPNSYPRDSYLLPSIAAVVIGGTNLAGGRGRVIGTAIAALFLSQLNALVLAMGAPSATQYISRR